jgi:hypothetical protein
MVHPLVFVRASMWKLELTRLCNFAICEFEKCCTPYPTPKTAAITAIVTITLCGFFFFVLDMTLREHLIYFTRRSTVRGHLHTVVKRPPGLRAGGPVFAGCAGRGYGVNVAVGAVSSTDAEVSENIEAADELGSFPTAGDVLASAVVGVSSVAAGRRGIGLCCEWDAKNLP